MEEHSCKAWHDGIYLVDGTLIAIAERPFWFGKSYFNQKCNYLLNIQVLQTCQFEERVSNKGLHESQTDMTGTRGAGTG
ncbi:hypothetical protein F5878DRAFT_549190 [Lentinula raphanica]|uniref:DDE Tnp4 domain-containing protein n=1 Tax=Lentinula raphanica TaxID=153919 RepID=A0AA38U3K4_9AGAR|nr:hypothetical protein F5878DRAFT_549190 [Lentinula raphanica]